MPKRLQSVIENNGLFPKYQKLNILFFKQIIVICIDARVLFSHEKTSIF